MTQIGSRIGSLVLSLPSHQNQSYHPPAGVRLDVSQGSPGSFINILDLYPATTQSSPSSDGHAIKFKYAAFLNDCNGRLSILDGSPDGSCAALLVFELYHQGLATAADELNHPDSFCSSSQTADRPASSRILVEVQSTVSEDVNIGKASSQRLQAAACDAVEDWAAAAWNRDVLIEQADKVEELLSKSRHNQVGGTDVCVTSAARTDIVDQIRSISPDPGLGILGSDRTEKEMKQVPGTFGSSAAPLASPPDWSKVELQLGLLEQCMPVIPCKLVLPLKHRQDRFQASMMHFNSSNIYI